MLSSVRGNITLDSPYEFFYFFTRKTSTQPYFRQTSIGFLYDEISVLLMLGLYSRDQEQTFKDQRLWQIGSRRIAARSMRPLTASTIRQYASTSHIAAKGPAHKAAAVDSGRKLTNYGKEFRPQKTFLHHTYSSILNNNRIMLICQHNNMSVPELIQLRTELAAAGADMKVIRLGIFAAALRETRYANLEPLINGPTCVISCNVSPEDEEAQSSAKVPKGLAGIRKIVEKNRKMILLGGKVDDALVSVDDMAKMVEMPGIQTLRSQVVGLLSQAGGGRLVQLLGMNPTLLVMNLDAHAKSGDAAPEA
ncbi:hypothetical protein BG015_000841 [Linnemannia schmuckeri]|uniref:50S ribosomal protein L10 n=1 Tax=Linnemannia schmuckeri TaxID=64567 RepID=A0A9P5V6V1_9FUNG|nr:hypothetical protein BG015_000841 [Linnemannia schmuckeri]